MICIKLSRREREILQLKVAGRNTKHTAGALEISIGCVNTRLLGLMAKLCVASRPGLIVWALQHPQFVEPGMKLQRGLHPAGCRCGAPYCLAMRRETAIHPEGCRCDAEHPLPRAA